MILNKCDLIPEEERVRELMAAFEKLGYPAFPVSAAMNQGFDPLLDAVVQMLPELPPPRIFEEEEERPG